jgi:hypothetical protein
MYHLLTWRAFSADWQVLIPMIRCRRATSVLGWVVLAALAAAPLHADDDRSGQQGQKSPFLRMARDPNQEPAALQAAIARCTGSTSGRPGVTVDLVAAVHVADRSYYRQLNREFRKYDAVLYELVAEKGTRIPKGGVQRGGTSVSTLQHLMKDVLDLEFQLNEIDYSPKNMVHADMSPEQFAQSMRRRGESVLAMFLRMLGYAFTRQGGGAGGTSDVQLLLALFDKNRALALKRVMAEQFQDMEGMLTALDGPKGSTMISERNKVALRELRKQLDGGKRKIAIFYGAGHMPDLIKRLGDEFGLVHSSTRWLNAWNLTAKPKGSAVGEPTKKTAAQ